MKTIQITEQMRAELNGIKIEKRQVADQFVEQIVKATELRSECSLATAFDSVI